MITLWNAYSKILGIANKTNCIEITVFKIWKKTSNLVYYYMWFLSEKKHWHRGIGAENEIESRDEKWRDGVLTAIKTLVLVFPWNPDILLSFPNTPTCKFYLWVDDFEKKSSFVLWYCVIWMLMLSYVCVILQTLNVLGKLLLKFRVTKSKITLYFLTLRFLR